MILDGKEVWILKEIKEFIIKTNYKGDLYTDEFFRGIRLYFYKKERKLKINKIVATDLKCGHN